MKYARRQDGPHRAIREALERLGCLVLDVSAAAGLGCDLIVFRGTEGRCVEVKDGAKAPSKRKLTDSEASLALRAGPRLYRIVGTVDEAIALGRELGPPSPTERQMWVAGKWYRLPRYEDA